MSTLVCNLCFNEFPIDQMWIDETKPALGPLCQGCGAWEARWAAMTPEERQAEIRSCDEYVADVERRRAEGEAP